ncbi:uncharacterized protein LOC130744152 [Lotus japonicus]|uniref:uncharacterized protein LOC130744152 n=1 Tax=Lotus japonicus TaxID=34305 RepID=UPI002582E1A5|nr:uncharacterized protein LOC130744152 [Lotus japonicus]
MAFLTVPYAILPCLGETENDADHDVDDNITPARSIFIVHDNMQFEWKDIFKGYEGAWCVGSSRGWLMFLDREGCPFLLNPSSSSFIQLPLFSDAFMHRAGIIYSCFVQHSLKTFVSKAVLMPSSSSSQHTLAILFSYPCRLAICTNASTWFEPTDAKCFYCDIVSYNNNVYALAEDGSLEQWKFYEGVPTKILDFKLTIEKDEEEEREFPKDKFSSKIYLVLSKGKLLLVKRLIGNFVNADGEVVYEGYKPPGHDGDVVCPYRTKHFGVYKLDFMKNKWVKKSSLHGQVLFLGTNESTSVSAKEFKGCKANSIYFTDDRSEEMNLDYSYGGHDWGVFSLADRRVKILTPFAYKMDPPPIWVVPTSDGFYV